MKMAFWALGIVTSFILLTGCAGYVVTPVTLAPAIIFADHSAPLDTNFQNTQIAGLKMGEASVTNILGLISYGDASARAAAEDGEISRIHHSDYHFKNILGIWSKYTTIVYGE